MATSERILGVEGGGTKTAWVLVERGVDGLRVIDGGRLPPSNFRLTSPDRLQAIFQQLPGEVDRVGMFLAGCGEDDRRELEMLCAQIWPRARIVSVSDRDYSLVLWLIPGRARRSRGVAATASNEPAAGAISWGMQAAATFFRSKRFALSCANTICIAVKQALRRIFFGRWR
jgi:hypothetical protein